MRIVCWQTILTKYQSYLIFFWKLREMLQKLLSAAVVIVALRVKSYLSTYGN